MSVAEQLEAYYSKPSIYLTAWKEFVRLYPDSVLLTEVKDKKVTFKIYELERNRS